MMFRAGPGSRKAKRRLDEKPEGWAALRDKLHALALEHGTVWLDLAGRAGVCPEKMDGRNFELWQPLLALACWVESCGEAGLLKRMQEYALGSIDAARDDQIPDADETLLEILTAEILRGRHPTPSEILEQAQERDQTTFTRWVPRTVSTRLKNYDIRTRKVDRRRAFRDTTIDDLARIETNYGIDLGISDRTEEADGE
jgi:hypothetical protein